MDSAMFWILAILIVVGVLLLVAVVATMRRSRASGVKITPLPAAYVGPYEARMAELEAMFVHQPREAVAAAKLLVDDMFHRMGYPIRMTNEERVKDLRLNDRRLSESYMRASNLKSDPTTEQLRLSLQGYMAMGRVMLSKAERPVAQVEESVPERPSIA